MTIKKIISFLIVLALLSSFSVSAFALNVPVGATWPETDYPININYGTIITNNTLVTENNYRIESNNKSVGENYGTVIDNNGTVDDNSPKGVVINNNGTISANRGTVESNSPGCTIYTNSAGTVETNNGVINMNVSGTVVENNGIIGSNYFATVETNNGTVGINEGEIIENTGKVETNNRIVTTNNGTVETNNKTIETNNGTVETNNKTIETNNGIVETNNSTIETNNSIVEANKGSVEVNYGTVTNIEGGSIGKGDDKITEQGTFHSVTYIDENDSIISNTTVKDGRTITVETPDEGYKWVEDNSKEEYTEETSIVVKAVKWFIKTLITPTIETPPPADPTTPPTEPTEPTTPPTKPADNSESTYVAQMRTITYSKGSSKDLSTGVKADGAEVQIKLKGNAINDFEVINGEVVLSAVYLETLNAGSYQICIIVSGVQTWLNLIVK